MVVRRELRPRKRGVVRNQDADRPAERVRGEEEHDASDGREHADRMAGDDRALQHTSAVAISLTHAAEIAAEIAQSIREATELERVKDTLSKREKEMEELKAQIAAEREKRAELEEMLKNSPRR